MKADRLPYPVYAPESPDYISVPISTDLSAEDDGFHISIFGEFRLADDTIQKMIESGLAYYALFIECSGTDYKLVKRCARKFKEKIIKAELADNIIVTPVVLAARDIDSYAHELLIEDYQGVPISIPEGGIIAFDDCAEITLQRGSPQTVESVCKFKMSSGDLFYEIQGDSIEIYLPEETFALYKKMNRQERLVLTSIYFPPVLTQIIQDVYYSQVYENDEVTGKKWHTAIENAIQSYGIDLGGMDAYGASMSIISGLLRDGAETVDLFKGVIE